MSVTSFSGPVLSTAGFQIGTEALPVTLFDANGTVTLPLQLNAAAGAAGGIQLFRKLTTAIADTTATTLATVTVTNVNASAIARILVRSGITAASHAYDSTRVVEYMLTITRIAGANAVLVLSAAVGAQIATVAAGQTLTTALSVAAVSGAVGAVNTAALQITNVVSVAGLSETDIFVELFVGTAGVTIA